MTVFRVEASARRHILYGDRRGGGHRSGAGRGKSEFPPSWSDDDIIQAIEDVANDLASAAMPGRGGRLVLIGTRASVRIKVVVDPWDGFIVTGFPG